MGDTLKPFAINNRPIGSGLRTYIIAEMSGNHGQSIGRAKQIITAAKECGADAIKLQTYTADTITINCNKEPFMFKGQSLYQLFQDAHTPWEWHSELIQTAQQLDLDVFSTPFDSSAVDFLETLAVPAYKIASSEIVDSALLKVVAATKKPVILSTGMATEVEIQGAIDTLVENGTEMLALLKCTATYPALPNEMNLRSIPAMSRRFGLIVGLSDHSMGHNVAVASVALGGLIIEKHLTLSRSDRSPDSFFSMEPQEFKAMVEGVRTVEAAMGIETYGPQGREEISRKYRRSLFIVRDILAGDLITETNVRSIRPGLGLSPEYFPQVLGRRARCNIEPGTPLSWDLLY